MNQGAHTAGTLRQEMGISGIPALEDDLQAPEESSAAPRVFHLAILDFHLYAKVTLDPWNGVNDNSCHCIAPFEKLTS
jgi:hypothetical protein